MNDELVVATSLEDAPLTDPVSLPPDEGDKQPQSPPEEQKDG